MTENKITYQIARILVQHVNKVHKSYCLHLAKAWLPANQSIILLAFSDFIFLLFGKIVTPRAIETKYI
jgi:hypothetical protein